VALRRLIPLEALELAGGRRVFVARSPASRLFGLALARTPPRGCALLIPRCRSVHTFGMRFALDVLFLDCDGRPTRLARSVPPGRILREPGAAAVVETPAGEGEMIRLMANGETGNRLLAALNPRQPIYRDTYNEYFVMVLSAGGAAAGTQVPLYILMAITGKWSVGVFVVACVVFELAVIFGLARPQMKRHERVGWAALWGATTAGLAICFYYLVADPTL
jgi:uncharacterized protein